MLIIQSQGYPLSSGNEKLIVVDYFLYLDTYEEYYKNESSFSSYKADNQTCLCNITRECVCTYFENALMHVENNTLIFFKCNGFCFIKHSVIQHCKSISNWIPQVN